MIGFLDIVDGDAEDHDDELDEAVEDVPHDREDESNEEPSLAHTLDLNQERASWHRRPNLPHHHRPAIDYDCPTRNSSQSRVPGYYRACRAVLSSTVASRKVVVEIAPAIRDSGDARNAISSPATPPAKLTKR